MRHIRQVISSKYMTCKTMEEFTSCKLASGERIKVLCVSRDTTYALRRTTGLEFLRCKACELCASFEIPWIVCVYAVQHPSCYHNSCKTNVFGDILDSACLSVCSSMCPSVHKILVILCREILLVLLQIYSNFTHTLFPY